MAENPIEIIGLHKSFGSFKALDGLDLTVRPGEIAGFLGPNGLHRGASWRTPGWGARRAELLQSFDLDPKKKARTYPKGNRQKVALVAAFLADTELYIFDEPTSGLDPLMEAVFTDHVRGLKAAGKSVLLSSHILSEVEKVCDTVTIIRNGRAVESGSIAELRDRTRTNVSAVVAQPPDGLAQLPGVHGLTTSGSAAGSRLAVTIVSLLAFCAYYTTATAALYPDFAARQARAASMSNAGGVFLSGPGYGLEDYTLGAMFVNEMVLRVVVFLAMLNISRSPATWPAWC
ncbi:hypothetical protein [Micromonospora sp. DT233]|uniref:ABC transporter ATP-binding protein n=1 Tax=Micromonospora sp. DT233 TaxID=3393432 RepID=UPI003CF91931